MHEIKKIELDGTHHPFSHIQGGQGKIQRTGLEDELRPVSDTIKGEIETILNRTQEKPKI